MTPRSLLQISRKAWDNRNPNTFHQLLLLKMMLGCAVLGILFPLYVTVFVRSRFDHIFLLQVLMWVVCFISYFRVRHDRQVYKASLVIVNLMTFLLLTMLISSHQGDVSGAYHHVVTILVAASFLLGPRFALPYFLLFLSFYVAVGSGAWHHFFPHTIPNMHPSRTSLYTDRILEITCAFGLSFMFDRMKIGQQARIKEQEHEVADKEKQLSINRVAGGIAHEINNPLTILLGYLELLERHEFNKKDLARINPRIQMAAKRIQFVIWSLNQVNNDRNKKGGVAPLEKAIQDVQLRVRDLNPKLTFDLDRGDGLKIRLSAEDLQNILYTVLENAVEALGSKADGIIKLRVLRVAEFVQIEVWDNGDDVIASDLQKFVEPFYTTKLDRPGRGMGLALSSAVIRAVGGQLVYRREGPWTVAVMALPGYDSTVLHAA
ncbi:MAG: HAMP domain-containing histidine kinase [Pseudobdellovibrionaceae bacterium]|nr:HAMP domain-containing histidine kinase [Pseudobdellovibrionaceae bacterium]